MTEVKVTGEITFRGDGLDMFNTVIRLDSKDGNRIFTPVSGVNKFTIFGNVNGGSPVVRRPISGNSTNALLMSKVPGCLVVV